MEEREPFEELEVPDEPEPSTDDVDGEAVGGTDDAKPWFDADAGSNGT
jgi:hypothetical protein